MKHTTRSRFLIAVLAGLWPAIGALHAQPRSQSSAVAALPAAPAQEANALTHAVTSPEWVTRKLVQREIAGLPASQTARVATSLVRSIDASHGRTATLRLLGQAHAAHPSVAIQASLGAIRSPGRSLEQRVHLAQFLVKSGAATRGRNEIRQVAAELMMQGDSEGWDLGLRLLSHVDQKSAWPQIEEALDAGDRDARLAAARALSEQRFDNAWPRLLELAEDPRRSIRRQAVQGLGLYPENPELSEVLRAILTTESDNGVCSRAFESAESLTPELGAELLIERFDSGDSCGPAHRFAILASLRRLLRQQPNMPATRDFLLGVVENPREPSEAGYAAAALGDVALAESLGGKAALDGLAMLTSRSRESTEVRMAAIDALARHRSPLAAERLETLLGRIQEPEEVTVHILTRLHESGRVNPEKAFLAAPFTASLERPELRALSVAYLSEKGDGAAVALRLSELLTDRDPTVVSTARSGLARIVGEDHGADRGAWTEALIKLAAQDARVKAGAENAVLTEDEKLRLEATANGTPERVVAPVAPAADRDSKQEQ